MELIVQDLIKAFGWSILNTVWQSGIIYAVIFLILVAAPKMKAAYRHNLAYGGLLAMFGWFLVTFIGYASKAGSIGVAGAVAEPAGFSLYEVNTYIQALPLTFAERAERLFPLIVVLYALGIVVQLFVVVKGYIYLRRIKTTVLSEVPEEWIAAFHKVRSSLGIKRVITFKLSGLVTVPVVAGYLKPVVLFPVALINQLDTDQVEAILIHELSHIRRNDYLLNIIKTCIETVLFFNPFVWLTGKFIQIEREHACDDLVVAYSGRPLSYAQTLLKLELIQQEQVPAYALAATGATQHLYQRIKRITNMKTNYLKTKQQLAALTLAIIGLLSVAWTNPAVKAKAVEVTKQIQESEVFFFASDAPAKIVETLEADTVKKKKKMTITLTDDDGKVTVYNSVAAMPDSLKKKMRLFSVPEGGFSMQFGAHKLFSDTLRFNSNFAFTDSLFATVKLPDMNHARLIQEDFFKQHANPEDLAKFRKLQMDWGKKPSAEELAKLRKQQEEWARTLGPKQQAEWKRLQQDMQRNARGLAMGNQLYLKMNSDSMRTATLKMQDQFKSIRFNADKMKTLTIDGQTISVDADKMIVNGKTILLDSLRASSDRLTKTLGNLSENFNFNYNYNRSTDTDNLKNSREYKRLTDKYKRDVEALKRKKAAELRKLRLTGRTSTTSVTTTSAYAGDRTITISTDKG